jgi:hypothetical protein
LGDEGLELGEIRNSRLKAGGALVDGGLQIDACGVRKVPPEPSPRGGNRRDCFEVLGLDVTSFDVQRMNPSPDPSASRPLFDVRGRRI